MNQTAEITRVARSRGDEIREALKDLMPIVDTEFQPPRFPRSERQNLTLRIIALKHETQTRLVDQREFDEESRSRFFGIAADLMRRLLVDYSRAIKDRNKHAATFRYFLGTMPLFGLKKLRYSWPESLNFDSLSASHQKKPLKLQAFPTRQSLRRDLTK